jgi:predicted permease
MWSVLPAALKRLLLLFKRARLDDELSEEIDLHIELRRQALVDDGMDPREADHAARRMFGNVTIKREEARDMWGFPSFDTIVQDLRYGLRLLGRSPVFTVIAVLSLAIGIGSTAAVFSLANALVLRKLPVVAPDELAVLRWQAGPRNPAGSITGNFSGDRTATSSSSFSFPAFDAFRQDAAAVAQVFGFASLYGSLDLTVDGQPEVGSGQVVSGNYFSTLGIRAAAGRLLLDTDDRAEVPPAAVISYGFWTERFGRAPDVVGKILVVNRVPVTIVGVTPKGFHGAIQLGTSPAVTLPMAVRPAIESRAQWRDPTYWWVLVMARVRPGVSLDAAQALLDQTLKRTAAEANPSLAANELPRLEVVAGAWGQDDRGGPKESLLIMGSVVGIVLLVACATVANLLLVRGVSRVREVALRVAIGASRQRIVRQLVTEGLLLALIGSALGLLVADSIAAWLLPALSNSPFGSFDIRTDWRVFLFTAMVAATCSVLFALVPSLRTTDVNAASGLQEHMRGTTGGRGGVRLTSGLVIVQVALSVLLVTVAGLLVYSLRNLQRVDPGFDASKTLIFRIDPVRAGYDLPRTRALLEEIQARLSAIPDVRSVSFSSATLISGGGSSGPAVPIETPVVTPNSTEDRELQRQYSTMRLTVGDGFFGTLGIPLLRGRDFAPGDTSQAQAVAVINRALAQRLFGEADPIGRQFRWGTTTDSMVMDVIGVCGDAKYTSIRNNAPPTLYTSYRQARVAATTFEVKTQGDPTTVVAQVREGVRGVDPHLPIAAVRTQEDQINASLQSVRLMATLATVLGGVAVLLASIGLYGILSYSVSRRIPEIGIRMALGAERWAVRWMVMKSALLLALVGVALGVIAALSGTSVVRSLLFGLSPTDPLTFVLAALLMWSVALVAAYLPARRASRVDPVVALRAD